MDEKQQNAENWIKAFQETETRKTQTQNTHTQNVCPNCGYCPHCGRGGYHMYPQAPWYQPPWYQPIGPTWIIPMGTTIRQQ